jgi:GT2 family glycosyltransferase
MPRPAVDVVVPFLGPPAELAELAGRLAELRLGSRDSVTIVDNRPGARGGGGQRDGPRVLAAPERQTPGFARNRGAALRDADWIVFLDADTAPPVDLLDRLFQPAPREETGLLAGGVIDEPQPETGREPPAARWARLTASMSQDSTLGLGRFGFAQTVNCAVRRAAFQSVGGFRDELRACEDADLCFRLEAAGWAIERREHAAVVHRSRRTLRALLEQQLVHGAGIGWLERQYPGSAPAHRWPGFLLWGLRHAWRGLARAARERDGDAALVALVDPAVAWTRELGRRRSNLIRCSTPIASPPARAR